ncbi:MAG: L-rhamnose mutarotase [Saprospiraceae bacterium]
MQRLAFKMKLKPGHKEVYIKRHNELWPELKALLEASGIREYSIFLDEETSTLFAFQKVKGQSGSQDLADNPIVQKWWDFMADIMDVNPDNSPISIPLEEVFYLKGKTNKQ